MPVSARKTSINSNPYPEQVLLSIYQYFSFHLQVPLEGTVLDHVSIFCDSQILNVQMSPYLFIIKKDSDIPAGL